MRDANGTISNERPPVYFIVFSVPQAISVCCLRPWFVVAAVLLHRFLCLNRFIAYFRLNLYKLLVGGIFGLLVVQKLMKINVCTGCSGCATGTGKNRVGKAFVVEQQEIMV